ncbi:hypothetical protein SDC9_196773 [bioreactor metagenome]|uniref:Uncharacterized protein n=1 Tax=bioreactor metagenome TaxID=1076179 RepID=A0A645IFA7_9ZZZZ
MFAFLPGDVGGQDHHLEALRKLLELFADGLGGLGGKDASALRTMGSPHMGIEKAEIVVNLGHGRDRGTRVRAGRALFNGNRGRKSFNMSHFRFLHPVEELTRIRGKAFHITALSLRIKGIEGQGGFAGPAQSGNDRQ